MQNSTHGQSRQVKSQLVIKKLIMVYIQNGPTFRYITQTLNL